MEQHVVETAKGVLDLSSVGVVLAVLMGWMPQMGAALTVLWLGARLYNEVMTAVYRSRQARKKG